MLNFFIDNIFVMFGGQVFQQTVGIPMCTSCAPLCHVFGFSYLYYHVGRTKYFKI